MPDTVTLVLDAEQYHRELAKITAGNQRLGASGRAIGESYLRGDRAVRVATGNIVQGLTTATNASDALFISAASLERVFRFPIGLTIFAAAGLAAVEVINKIIEKEQKLKDEIHRVKLESTLGGDFLSSDQIKQNLTDSSAKIKEISDDLVELKAGKGKFLGIDFMGSETRAFFEAEDERKLSELRGAAGDDVLKLTSKQNELNRASQETVDKADDLAEADKLRIDHNERLGALSVLIKNAQLQETEAAKQLLSVENDRYNIAVKLNRGKLKDKLTKDATGIQASDVPGEIADFNRSITRKVNLAPILRNQAAQAEDLARAQASQGDLVEAGRLHQIAQERLDKANEVEKGRAFLEADARVRFGVVGDAGSQVKPGFQNLATKLQELSGLTFKGLKDVDNLTFEGLKVLNGLTLSIQ